MATISGTDNAFMFALSGVLRAGAGRAGYHSSSVYITVAGTDRTSKTRLGSLSIQDNLDHEPNTASIVFTNEFTPAIGNSIVIQLGSTDNAERLFGGRILSTNQVYEDADRQSVVWECSLIDFTWELNQKLVRGQFKSQDASTIIASLVADFAPEFTSTARDYTGSAVDATLGTIDEITFTEVNFGDAITRIMRRVGGHWKVEYHQIVQAFLSDTYNPPRLLDDTETVPVWFRDAFLRKDNSQLTTRALVEGQGTAVLEQVAVGQTSIPVEDGSIWDATGGAKAKAPNGQIITYTGRTVGDGAGSTISNALAAPGAPAVAESTVGVLFGSYKYKVGLADSSGETVAGTASATVTPDKTYTSTEVWASSSPLTANPQWEDVAWSPAQGIYCAVSDGGVADRAATSPDGVIWTIQTGIANQLWSGIAWSPSLALFVAVSSNGSNRVATSSDGVTWTGRTAHGTEPWSSIVWNPDDGLFVAVANNASAAANAVMTSTDGITWTGRTAPSAIGWFGVAWSNAQSLFVAVATNAGTASIMTSPDGVTWTGRTSVAGAFRAVEWAPSLGIFVAIANGVNYETSTNGTSWTQRTLDATLGNEWRSIAWSVELSQFMAVARTGTDRVMASTTGTSWTGQNAASASDWRGVVWAPDLLQWVGVGDAASMEVQTINQVGEKVALSSIATGASPTTKRILYRTEDGGTVYKALDTINNNSTTIYTDNIPDESLGAVAPTISSVAVNAGDTAIRVQALENFQAGGGWVEAGGQPISYTGRSGSSGEGTLTGVPASGQGTIIAGVPAGGSVVPIGFLSGVPSSGAGSVLVQMEAGEKLNIYITRNDAAAQSALATLLGGSADGVFEQFIQDRRLSQTEAENRGDAILTLQKDAFQEFTYASRDPKTRSGKTITVDLTSPQSIDTTFKIQSVSISEIDEAPSFVANESGHPVVERNPLYTVRASTMRFSFEDLLRLMRRGSENREA